MSEIKTTTIAKINEVDILLIENGEKRVAIKPICEALGIDVDSQRKKLNDDPILNSVTVLSTATGKDGKGYQMVTIPLKYVFGWLFRIDSRNVKEEAREALLKYQIQCYDALYNYFTSYADFVEEKQLAIECQLLTVDSAKDNFKYAKNILDEANKRLKKLRGLTFQDYDAESRQLKIFTEENMINRIKD
jgi:hypothetical protein